MKQNTFDYNSVYEPIHCDPSKAPTRTKQRQITANAVRTNSFSVEICKWNSTLVCFVDDFIPSAARYYQCHCLLSVPRCTESSSQRLGIISAPLQIVNQSPLKSVHGNGLDAKHKNVNPSKAEFKRTFGRIHGLKNTERIHTDT